MRPGGGAITVVFFFPYGDTALDGVDDVATGIKSGIPMSCRNGDVDRHVTDGEVPYSVLAKCLINGEALFLPLQ